MIDLLREWGKLTKTENSRKCSLGCYLFVVCLCCFSCVITFIPRAKFYQQHSFIFERRSRIRFGCSGSVLLDAFGQLVHQLTDMHLIVLQQNHITILYFQPLNNKNRKTKKPFKYSASCSILLGKGKHYIAQNKNTKVQPTLKMAMQVIVYFRFRVGSNSSTFSLL